MNEAKAEPGNLHSNLSTQEIASRLGVLLAPRFAVIKLLALGGTSSVFLVRHRLHQGLFAVKVLNPSLASQTDALARFKQEVLLGARLAGHPHIAPVLDAGEGDGLYYFLMPFIPGEDLDRLLARVGSLSLADSLQAIGQINDALGYAWTQGILHGDVTPGNLRLNAFGQFVLFDFGLASMEPEAGESTVPAIQAGMGTPLYMSPEQILGEKLDVRSDLYSLGAVLYEMLTGEAAFKAGTLQEIEHKHLDAGLVLPAKLPPLPGLRPFLGTLLARRSSQRFADPYEVQQALRILAAYPPGLTVKPAIQTEPLAPGRRRRLS